MSETAAEREIVVRLAEGLHARPAARVAQLAKSFASSIDIVKGEAAASARSTVKLMLLAVKEGERIRVRAAGADAEAALAELCALIGGDGAPELPASAAPAEAVPAAPPPADEPPPSERGLLVGVAASDGVVLAPAFVHGGAPPDPPVRRIADADRPAEVTRFRQAAAAVAAFLDKAAARAGAGGDDGRGATEAQVFGAVRELAEDPALLAEVETLVAGGQDAASATIAVGQALADNLARIDDPYFQLRADDLRGVSRRIARVLLGAAEDDLAALDRPSVLLAAELSAVELAQVPAHLLAGLVTSEGGASSHVAIIARSLGIPAVVGVRLDWAALAAVRTVGVDGTAGIAVLDPPPAVAAGYERRARAAAAERQALQRFASVEPKRADGTIIEVAANIGSPDEVDAALRNGAMGVGLFRTEFLFMQGSALPTEEEQYRVYRRVLAAMAPRPVIVRTLDIGGDKQLPGLATEPESNPFLGWRGIRMCLGRPELFHPQLRALLRSAVHGRLRVMFPMISDLAEVHAARAVLRDCAASLEREGIATGPVDVGIMIETPAAALCAAELADAVDFFSIGTNDLTQYTMAADRTNPLLASLGRVEHPAVQRLIERTCAAARERGIPVGICGEAAADPALIPQFLRWGVTELSMSASLIPRAKQAIVAASEAHSAQEDLAFKVVNE